MEEKRSDAGEKGKQIAALIDHVNRLEDRVQRLEREMSAIGKMEGAIKSLFTGGEASDPATTEK